jgi:hypothetical protein
MRGHVARMRKKCIHSFGRKERDHSEDLGVDGTLKLIDLSELRLLGTGFIYRSLQDAANTITNFRGSIKRGVSVQIPSSQELDWLVRYLIYRSQNVGAFYLFQLLRRNGVNYIFMSPIQQIPAPEILACPILPINQAHSTLLNSTIAGMLEGARRLV